MGMPFMSRGSTEESTPAPRPGNPVAHRFAVRATYRSGRSIAVRVHYPDCANYEGNKVLVFEDAAAFDALVARGTLDPHFMESGPSPIARFRPDEAGWVFACALADGLGARSW